MAFNRSILLAFLCITAQGAAPTNEAVSPVRHLPGTDKKVDQLVDKTLDKAVDDDEADVSDDDDDKTVKVDDVKAVAAVGNNTVNVAAPVKFMAIHGTPAASQNAKNLGSTAASLEAAVTDMMLGGAAFDATPMGSSVKQIADIIKSDMFPKVTAAHEADQNELDRLLAEIKKCDTTKKSRLSGSGVATAKYRKESKSHKSCRDNEAVKFTTKKNCLTEQKNLLLVKKSKCDNFATISDTLGTTKANSAIVTKAGGESVESYITRISTTICGKHTHGKKGTKKTTGGWGGGLKGGFLDQHHRAKDACEKATKKWKDKVKDCKKKVAAYSQKKGSCDNFQEFMDAASCQSAIIAKDACETYAQCYTTTVASYQAYETNVRKDEVDRKAEWRGLSRMTCLIGAFGDGKVTGKEVDGCKKKSVDTKSMDIKYPKIPKLATCAVPQLYPATGKYKRTEYAPLPMLAKGKESVECSGVQEISLKPASGSPSSCKCKRVTLNGYYSAGSMVACKGCTDVSKSTDKNSCPKGTKIFSPGSEGDWKTLISSAVKLAAPDMIIDITKPQDGGAKNNHHMNSGNRHQKAWQTLDGSPWWLRSSAYGQPDGNYAANCFLGIHSMSSEKSITFDDNNCQFHSSSYYCQLLNYDDTPKSGSPSSCKCSNVVLTGSYTPGRLVKCEECLPVSKATQKNSCPEGMKIFSPRSRSDWKTFIKSAKPLRAPHFIFDVTRASDGTDGKQKDSPMKSTTPEHATWRTSDRSAWWLRSSGYSQPDGDYKANCFMDLWKTPHNSEDNIQFNDHNCNYNSRSYYCQPIKKKIVKPKPTPPKVSYGPWKRINQDKCCDSQLPIGGNRNGGPQLCGSLAEKNSQCNPNMIFYKYTAPGTSGQCYCVKKNGNCDGTYNCRGWAAFERKPKGKTQPVRKNKSNSCCSSQMGVGGLSGNTKQRTTACFALAAKNSGCNPNEVFFSGTSNCWCVRKNETCDRTYACSSWNSYIRR